MKRFRSSSAARIRLNSPLNASICSAGGGNLSFKIASRSSVNPLKGR